MMSRRVKIMTTALVLVVLFSAGNAGVYRSAGNAGVYGSAGNVVVREAQAAIGLVGSLLARGLLRTISMRRAERHDRSNINKRRDEELKEVEYRVQAVAVQEQSGGLTAADAARERERYQVLKVAIEERAKRERQVTSYQTRQRIRKNLASTFVDVLKVATGADPRVIDFVAGLVRGESPVAAAMDAALSGGASVADPRQPFRDLQATLKEVEKTARSFRGARGIALRARLRQALREAGGLAEGDGPPPADKIALLKDLERQIQNAFGQIAGIRGDLFPRSEGIDRERFATNERWLALDAAVKALEGPLAGRVIVSATMRAAIAEATRLADEANIKLSPKQIDQIAAQVAAAWVEQRKRGLSAGEISIQELVRAALNEALVVGAQPLLPGTTAYWALDSTFIRPNKPGVAQYQEGGFSNWVVKQTSTSMEYRTVKDGEVTADLSIEFKYDSPPKYLRPGDTLELQATGKITARKDFDRGYLFKLYYNSSTIELGPLARGSSSKTFKIEVPPLPGDRERFSIRVGIEALNCKADSCNATWVYEPRAGPMPQP